MEVNHSKISEIDFQIWVHCLVALAHLCHPMFIYKCTGRVGCQWVVRSKIMCIGLASHELKPISKNIFTPDPKTSSYTLAYISHVK